MSAAANPYRPEAGTVPERVVAWFAQRPDLYEMTSAQVADQFGINVKNVSGTLARCVHYGLLAVRREGRGCYYRAGNGVPAAGAFPYDSGGDKSAPASGTEAAADAPAAPAATGLTLALYQDGELYIHGVQVTDEGALLLSLPQAAMLREYLLHTGGLIDAALASGGRLS